MNRLIVGIFLGALVSAPALATEFYHHPGGISDTVVAGGIVAADGRVIRGGYFTVAHPETGHYIIQFTPGFFPRGCASMVANPWAGRLLIANVAVTGCKNNGPVFHVIVQHVDGRLEDKHFSFIVTGV